MAGVRSCAALARCLTLGLVLATTAGCARTLYNFGEIDPGVIYRSAQPSPMFLRYLVNRYGVRSLINLRGRTPGFESQFAARNGLKIFTFDLSASRPPTQRDVERFLAIVADPTNQPVLVHCRNGVDRTGYMVGLYRLERQGWTPEQVTHEMNRFMQFSVLNSAPQRVITEGARSPAR